MAKQKIKWTSIAKKSINEILDYYNFRNGNSIFSLKILIELKNAISLLPNNNFMGKQIENSELRVFVLERYHIFYKVSEELIEIRLIWNSQRNPEELKLTDF